MQHHLGAISEQLQPQMGKPDGLNAGMESAACSIGVFSMPILSTLCTQLEYIKEDAHPAGRISHHQFVCLWARCSLYLEVPL